MAKIVFHLKAKDANPVLSGLHLRLYRVIRDICAAEGIACVIRPRDADITVGTRVAPDTRFEDGDLHIIDDRSVQGAGVLNCGVAYFWQFWHLDPVGTKAFSSIGARKYAAASMSADRVALFAGNLRKRYSDSRTSKYGQPEDVATFPAGAVAVFFQGTYPVNAGATRLTDEDVLRAVQAGAGDRPIIVKPHPKASTKADLLMAQALAKDDPRVIVTQANVHDILTASVATASVNSTVALEGFMHAVPAVLFGISDFHHVASTVTNPQGFAAALDQELQRREDYDRYLAWYFLKNCVPLNYSQTEQKIWDRFAAAGFPKDVFH